MVLEKELLLTFSFHLLKLNRLKERARFGLVGVFFPGGLNVNLACRWHVIAFSALLLYGFHYFFTATH